jgi:hypothetical protein
MLCGGSIFHRSVSMGRSREVKVKARQKTLASGSDRYYCSWQRNTPRHPAESRHRACRRCRKHFRRVEG